MPLSELGLTKFSDAYMCYYKGNELKNTDKSNNECEWCFILIYVYGRIYAPEKRKPTYKLHSYQHKVTLWISKIYALFA